MEFNLIEKYFKSLTATGRGGFYLGDDGAVISTPTQVKLGSEVCETERLTEYPLDLVVVTDTLVEGVHFYSDIRAYDLGWKALAVNLSDLAAMGAKPAFYSLALTLPQVDEAWLEGFTAGMQALARQHKIVLVGGDTTSGKELSITITAQGWVDKGKAILRSGAKVGDDVYVSGFIGDAGFGLAQWNNSWLSALEQEAAINFVRPDPRVDLGQKLVGLASSCIDISDGLLADLNHILNASGVGVVLDYSAIPLRDVVKRWVGVDRFKALTAGEDFELCFTASPDYSDALEDLSRELSQDYRLVKIGEVVADLGINLDGELLEPSKLGYQHFSVK